MDYLFAILMPSRIIEIATGIVDGVNKTFSTSQAYEPGSVVGFLQGMARIEITELGGVDFILDNEPPDIGETISVHFVTLA